MLKWSVTRKVSQDESNEARPQVLDLRTNNNKRRDVTADAAVRVKCRRSSTSRRRSSSHKPNSPEHNKENCFTSTPIKSSENYHQHEALRDVSNLTPKANSIKRNKREHSDKKKKKKRCLEQHQLLSCGRPQDFYAPTLPTFQVEDSPCFLRGNVNVLNRKSCPLPLTLKDANYKKDPPKKKLKVRSEDRILCESSSSDTEFESKSNSPEKLTVSPLVKRLIDLRFSKIQKENVRHNNSSYINNLSLDKIVDAILDTTNENNNSNSKEISSGNTSMVVNLDPRLQERENELNETHEENLINSEHERQISVSRSSCDRNSFDSGFSSTTAKQHNVGINFKCKCNNKVTQIEKFDAIDSFEEKTIIDLGSTYNERCVDVGLDVDMNTRKRSSSPLVQSTFNAKRLHLETLNANFTLKRQKCIRRRRPSSTKSKQLAKELNANSSHFSDFFDNEDSKNSRTNFDNDSTSKIAQKPARRCLSFESSTNEDFGLSPLKLSPKNCSEEVRGCMELKLMFRKNHLIFRGKLIINLTFRVI